jgi:hypothetical protein
MRRELLGQLTLDKDRLVNDSGFHRRTLLYGLYTCISWLLHLTIGPLFTCIHLLSFLDTLIHTYHHL